MKARRRQTRHGHVAGVAARAEGARDAAAASGVQERQAAINGLIGSRRDHVFGGGAVRQRLARLVAFGVVARQGERDAARPQQPQHAPRYELTARPHGSVSLAPALFGDGAVILADEASYSGMKPLVLE